MKIKTAIILGIVALILGFLLGRCSNINENIAKTEEVVKYIPSPYSVHDTIYKPKPYEVIKHDMNVILVY